MGVLHSSSSPFASGQMTRQKVISWSMISFDKMPFGYICSYVENMYM